MFVTKVFIHLSFHSSILSNVPFIHPIHPPIPLFFFYFFFTLHPSLFLFPLHSLTPYSSITLSSNHSTDLSTLLSWSTDAYTDPFKRHSSILSSTFIIPSIHQHSLSIKRLLLFLTEIFFPSSKPYPFIQYFVFFVIFSILNHFLINYYYYYYYCYYYYYYYCYSVTSRSLLSPTSQP